MANIWYSPIEVLYTTNIMTNVEDHLRGRVFAAALSVSRTAHIIGFVLVGVIGDILSVSTIAWGIGLFLVISGIVNRIILSRSKDSSFNTVSVES